jgi:hypothetical protein
MTSCLENLTDNCYKKSFFIPTKTRINFKQIRAAVLAFRNKLKNKYPWKTGECENNNCKYTDEIKNPNIGYVEVLKSKERLRLIFSYLIYIEELQNPVDIIPDIKNNTSLEFIAVENSTCQKCKNNFTNTYGYKYGNPEEIFICINCVINYIYKKVNCSDDLAELFYTYDSVIKDGEEYLTVKFVKLQNIFKCNQCNNTFVDRFPDIQGDKCGNFVLTYQTDDHPYKNYCLSCIVNVTEPTIPMKFRRLNSHKKRSPKRSKKKSCNRSKKRSSKRSKKRSSKRSKKRSSKRSKRASRKKSK